MKRLAKITGAMAAMALVFTVAALLLPALPLRAQTSESVQAVASAESANTPAKKAGEMAVAPLDPERYYALVLDRQRLAISSYRQIVKILDAHRNDPLAAMSDLKRHEMEREARSEALFAKYGVSAQDYYRSQRGRTEQKERAKYLDKHPEIRDEIAANSSEIRQLETQVWARMQKLWVATYQPK